MKHNGAITRIATPDGRMPAAYAVNPDNTNMLFVSDGQTISRSLDGGCTWSDVYDTNRQVQSMPPVYDVSSVLETVDEIIVRRGNGQSANDVVYATLTPCVAAKVLPDVSGCAVLVSHDGGRRGSWTFTAVDERNPLGMFPADVNAISDFTVSPTDPNRVYMMVQRPRLEFLYVSSDGARTWTQISSTAAAPIAVDPIDADSIWAGGPDGLLHSVDAGKSWVTVRISSGISQLDVAHVRGSPAVITAAYPAGGVVQSRQSGLNFRPLVGAPGPVTSIAHGSRLGDLAITTDTTGTSAGAPFVYSPATGWKRVPRAFREVAASSINGDPETFYFADPNVPPSLVAYTPASDKDEAGPIDIQAYAQLGRTAGKIDSCYEGPGVEPAPGPVTTKTDPAPQGEGPILVDNEISGCVVAFDRFGHSRILLQAPQYAEGIALTFDKQLIITTRTSNMLTLTKLPHQVYSVLDADIPSVEGPSFDRHGNLFVEDNDENVVFEYPFPQYPGEPRIEVWSFGRRHFIEDTRTAPPGSPFAGDLFVEVFEGRVTGGTNPDPNTIAILEPTKHGWRRIADFAHFPTNFASLGFAFLPDGSVLVPDWHGSGVILKYSPDGKTVTPFAKIGTTEGVYAFVKIDVTARGYVYASSVAGQFASCSPDPDGGLEGELPAKCDYVSGTRNAIVRFDPKGNRMLPDFTENLDAPVGIAVPNVITGLKQILPPSPARVKPPRTVVTAEPPPPVQAPPQPVTGPVATTALIAAPAPGAAPAGQAQAQTNPVSQAQTTTQMAAVTQTEERVQVALAQANRSEQAATDPAMSALRLTHPHRDVPMAATMLAGAVVLLGCAVRWGPRPQLARAQSPPEVRQARTRRRRRE